MSQVEQQGTSRSVAIYRLLLNLYPQQFLRQHRAEMLQNFEDIERNSSSNTELWLFFGKDLAISITTQSSKSLWGQTTIVSIALAVLLAAARRHSGQHEPFIWGFCVGYALGWLSGWWRKRRQIRLGPAMPHYFKSFLVDTSVICIILLTILIVEYEFARMHERPIWGLCYGFILAWPAGWLGKRWQSRP